MRVLGRQTSENRAIGKTPVKHKTQYLSICLLRGRGKRGEGGRIIPFVAVKGDVIAVSRNTRCSLLYRTPSRDIDVLCQRQFGTHP